MSYSNQCSRLRRRMPLLLAALAALALLPAHAGAAVPAVAEKGDTAWMLTSTLLVLLMAVPGLAMFYGGMVRAKNTLSVMVQVAMVFSLLVLLWVAYGYSVAFSAGSPWIGGMDRLLLRGIGVDSLIATPTPGVGVPEYLFIAFQATFAGITGALVVGAWVERAKLPAVLLFIVIWFSLGYLPLAHMVWASDGFLFKLGALDFAGGTVVHINAGMAGLVGAWCVGKRLGYGQTAIAPHNLAMTFAGAALLWAGWFGFNAGSALEANASAALAFLNTLLAPAAAVLGWTLAEKRMRGKASALGVASGMVAGLVAITPACGTVGPAGAIVMGLVTGAACVWGVNGLKRRLRADDSLDVFGVHGLGGILGALLTGVFSADSLGGTKSVAAGYSIAAQLGVQALGVTITLAWIGLVSMLACTISARACGGLRVDEDAEHEGLDIAEHGETAYQS